MKAKKATSRLKPPKITLTMLKKWNACQEQRDLFKKIFPRGVVINRQNAEKAVRGGLQVDYLIKRMLTRPKVTKYYIQERPLRNSWRSYQVRIEDMWGAALDCLKLSIKLRAALQVHFERLHSTALQSYRINQAILLADMLTGVK